MAYGEIKIDTITFTAGGSDTSISVSGLVQNPTFTGNITTTGTISGDVIRGQTVSGVTVTGGTGQFGTLTAVSGVFTTQVSGATVTGNVGLFTSITGGTQTITSGIFASGTQTNPSLTFVGDLDTGIYSPGANELAISTNGTGRLFIDASGRVIVGASSAAVGNPFEVVATSNGNAIAVRGRSSDNLGIITFHPNASSTEYARIQVESDSSLRFGTGSSGTERMHLDSSGRLGLGTSSPGAKLQVSQNTDAGTAISAVSASASTSLTTDYATLFLQNTNTTNNNYNAIGFVNDQGGYSSAIYGIYTSHTSGAQSGALAFSTRNAGTFDERMRITAAGNVGIGTTSPGSKLEVNGKTVVGSTSSDALEVFSSGDTEIGFSYATRGNIYAKIIGDITSASPLAGEIAFQTASGGSLFERARLDSSGRLLVGTSSSPSAGLGQYGVIVAQGYAGNAAGSGEISIQRGQAATAPISANSGIGTINFCDNVGNTFGYIGCVADAQSGSNDYPGRLVFSTTADGASSPTERMRLDSYGALSQFGSLNGVIAHSSTGAGSSYVLFRGYHSATAGTPFSGTVSFQVNTNGNVANTNNSYTALSDIKLKENIVDAKSQWDDIKALRVVNYNFKPETGAETFKQLGLIAQEVETVCPSLVGETPDQDENGENIDTVTKTVNYSVLYMKAVKALQEAMERIESLEAKVAALEAS